MGGGEVLFPVSGCILVGFCFADHSFACNQFLMTAFFNFIFWGGDARRGGEGEGVRRTLKNAKVSLFLLKIQGFKIIEP